MYRAVGVLLGVAGVIAAHLVRRARRAINHSLGAGFDHRDVVRMNARSFCEELVEDPRLLRLATNPDAWSRVRSLLGERCIERPSDCQIALRIPRPYKGNEVRVAVLLRQGSGGLDRIRCRERLGSARGSLSGCKRG